jgi:tripartite-type tricarboxylate transporter receptor subunit TctC
MRIGKTIVRNALGFALIMGFQFGNAAQATDYPTKPITATVNVGAGGVDIYLRALAPKMTEVLGQPIVIENREGASGGIGVDYVKNSPNHGYSLLFCSIQHLMPIEGIRQTSGTLDDFVPIGTVVGTPVVFTARADAPFKTLPEMISYMRDNPRTVTMGTGGPATASHIDAWTLQSMAGVEFKYVPFRGVAPAITAQLSGTVDLTSAFASMVNSHVEAGTLRYLAITSEERSPFLPDVPTFKELGYDLVNVPKVGLFAPKGTPPEVVEKLDEALRQAVNSPEYADMMRQSKSELFYWDANASQEGIKAEYEYWQKQLETYPRDN